MHIFLVNDDGIGSMGIMALAHAASQRNHRVTLCAPASQQSAASQRISLIEPIFVSPYPVDDPAISAYAIKGTPTDCVRLGLLDLAQGPVDVLVSGINDGYNAGMAVHYSGTVSAAREGALNHLHAIAASIDYHATQEMVDHLARFVISTAERYSSLPLPPGVFLNINAPGLEPDKLLPPVMAPLSTANFTDRYLRRESPRAGVYYWLDEGSYTEAPGEGSDQDMLEKGHVTLSFMGNPSDHSLGFASFLQTCQTSSQPL